MIWENIDNYHRRTRVFGGWLVKAYEDIHEFINDEITSGYNWRVSMTFVPDPMELWKLPSPEIYGTISFKVNDEHGNKIQIL